MKRFSGFGKIACVLFLCLNVGFIFAETPQELYTQGKIYQNQEEWYFAIEYYREAVTKNSAYGEAWKGLAECAYGMDEYTLALSYLTTARKYLQGDPSLDSLEAFSQIGLGNLDTARLLFEKVLLNYPNDKEARFGLAELDIAQGKSTTASKLYLEALRRQPESKKALLSLAILYGEAGDFETAKKYANLALLYHGGNAQVYYYAAWLSAREGLYEEAEGRVRGALRLDSKYDKASELLAAILFAQRRYSEVIEICDNKIAEDRTSAAAWYLKALSQENLKQYEAALKTFETGISVAPDDLLMRTACESLILHYLPLEDARRNSFAKYHAKKAENFSSEHYSEQATFEYRRALKLDPYDASIRLNYANLLLKLGYKERYVDQLTFIKQQGKQNRNIEDSLETYLSLNRTSIANKWGVNVTILDKTHLSLGLYYVDAVSNVFHPQAERLTTELLAEVLSHDGRYSVSYEEKPVANFTQAFRQARLANQEYFGIVSLEEASDRIRLKVSLYVSRTGLLAKEFVVYRSGVDNYYSALRKMSSNIVSAFPKRCKILQRIGNIALIDAGRADGVTEEEVFTIFKESAISVADEGIGIRYKDTSIIGTAQVSSCGEDLSEVELTRVGFYDRMVAGDQLVVLTPPTEVAETLSENLNTTTELSTKNQIVESTDIKAPRLLEMLRDISE